MYRYHELEWALLHSSSKDNICSSMGERATKSTIVECDECCFPLLFCYSMHSLYCSQTGVEEVVTKREIEEAKAFLGACMDTRPMQYVYKYCQEKVIPKAE